MLTGMQSGGQIVLHFVWTISVAALFFEIGSALFHFVLLFNAGFSMAVALTRGDPWRIRRVTLWDEAAALLGVCGITLILR
jgi:hypothetical protein